MRFGSTVKMLPLNLIGYVPAAAASLHVSLKRVAARDRRNRVARPLGNQLAVEIDSQCSRGGIGRRGGVMPCARLEHARRCGERQIAHDQAERIAGVRVEDEAVAFRRRSSCRKCGRGQRGRAVSRLRASARAKSRIFHWECRRTFPSPIAILSFRRAAPACFVLSAASWAISAAESACP